MRIVVGSMVFLPKDGDRVADGLGSAAKLREELTISRRVFEDEGDGDVELFAENDRWLGVPRVWFQRSEWSRLEGREGVEVVNRTSFGSPMARETTLEHTGQYAEQGEAITAIVNRFEAARSKLRGRHPVVRPPGGILRAKPGFGKTNTAIAISCRLGVTTMIVVHKKRLLQQWVKRIERFVPGAKVGIVQEGKCDIVGKDFAVAMAQSLALDDQTRYPAELYSWAGLAIFDECFPSLQRVITEKGPTPISEVMPGDSVANAVGAGMVTRRMRREVPISRLVVVRTTRGKVVCTKEHPFLTEDGWIKAGYLAPGDRLVDFEDCTDIMHSHGIDVSSVREAGGRTVGSSGEILFSPVLRQGETKADGSVRGVRDGDRQEGPGGNGEAKGATWRSLLFDLLSAEVVCEDVPIEGVAREAVIRHASVAREGAIGGRGVVEADDGAKSDAPGIGAEEVVGDASRDGAPTSGAGRKRPAHAFASVEVVGSPRGWMGFRIGGQHGGEEGKRDSLPLQGGHRERGGDDRCGGGRVEPRIEASPSRRYQEGSLSGGCRVESVSSPEPEDLDGFERGHRGDSIAVYNLSVSGHPSYVLDNGVIVHNCHRVSAPTWSPIPARLEAFYRLGLSATPRRKDGAERVFFDHIGPVIFKAETEMEPVSVRVKHVKTQLPSVAYEPKILRRAIVSMICRDRRRDRVILGEIMGALKSPAGRKIMVLSHRIEHLERIEEVVRRQCKAEGLEAPSVGHYAGEWPEPGMQERLVPGGWVMDEAGRKKAILAIYSSLSRRKSNHPKSSGNPIAGEIGKRTWTDPWTGTEVTGKSHVLISAGELAPDIWPTGTEHDGVKREVILEELEDQQLFDIARIHAIRQDRRRKMRAMTEADFFEAEQAQLILATFQMTEEGLDIPAVDTEVFASPIGDPEQAIGRSQRFCRPVAHGGKATPEDCAHFCAWRASRCEGKAPVVLSDIVDDVEIRTIASAWAARRDYYRSQGFRVGGGAGGPRRLVSRQDKRAGDEAIQLAFRDA